MRQIQRVAAVRDTERYEEANSFEDDMPEKSPTSDIGLNLKMKISDIELQSDGRKVIFFYTAEPSLVSKPSISTKS